MSAQASTQCQESAAPQPLAVRPTVLVPVATGFAIVNPQLGSQRGVLASDFDESQSVDNVLWRLRVEGCQNVAVAVPASAAAASASTYVKLTEHDNTPYRFNMTQNGKRMTADDFDAWLQANGYSAGRRVDPNAAPAPAAESAAETPPIGQ
ncbi:hypothetical protein FQY83_16460 [Luteimonas marina]|uniref:Uncharacterized protein n=2 Tax=Luteimonas marina TaxID=488485 RepID=A0A5C5TWW1_9GAMM|nr:hypothetical protein FQY83_16460 [Luteimonas marina]